MGYETRKDIIKMAKTAGMKSKEPLTDFSRIAATIKDTPLDQEIENSFLSYSYMVILQRAIADARDGMKPVHRRIIHSMNEDRYTPEKNHVKSAKIVGAVIGNYHTFGDQACYSALARLAQDFSMRVPLISGHGNFGLPGTPPASQRYTEARLSPEAMTLVADLAEDGVPMKPNYDSTRLEPEVLPVRFPNLIINGGSGIAVGMATNIAPHNPTEIMEATKYLLKNPNATTKQLMKYVPGPDFPTGGEIVGIDQIEQAFETGRGTFRIRGKYTISPTTRGKHEIVFTEIPYEAAPETIIEQVKKALKEGKLEGLYDAKDLTDRRNGTRIVFETKTGVNPSTVLARLFTLTSLEVSFGVNNVAIVEGEPKTLGLLEILQIFLDFRRDVVRRRSDFRKTKRETRLHLVNGLLKALANIDEVIKIVRNADNAAVASTGLQKKFKIDDVQAQYILEIPLKRLTKLDQIELQNEKDKLESEIAELKKILGDPKILDALIYKELGEVQKQIARERKSTIIGGTLAEHMEAAKEVAATAASASEVADEPCYVVVTPKFGLVRVAKPYTRPARSVIQTTTRGRFVAVTNKGRGFKVDTLHVGEKETKADSVLPVKLARGEQIIAVTPLELEEGKVGGIALGTKNGSVKITAPQWPVRSDEFTIVSLAKDDEIVNAQWVPDVNSYDLVFITSDSSFLTFPASKVRPQGLSGAGMAGISLKNTHVVTFDVVETAERNTYVVVESTGKSIKATPFTPDLYPSKGRGTGGYSTYSFVRGETELVAATVSVKGIMLTTSGSVVPLPTLVKKRVASGTKLEKDGLF